MAAATRAGQLCLGKGNPDQAEHLAHRALNVDPSAEDTHGVLIAAALTSGQRSIAHRRLEHCLDALADLLIEPSHATRQLRRRIQADPSPEHRHGALQEDASSCGR